jgi:hypothetical protein
MTPDLNKLTEAQVERLVGLLARFAAWLDYCEAHPDAEPSASFATAEKCQGDYRDVARDFLVTGQAIRETAPQARPKLFEPDD